MGKMKEPISMQRTASLIYLGGFERGMNLDGLLPARNTGIMYYVNLLNKKAFFSIGAFNQLSAIKNVKFKDANSVAVGRLTVNPMVGWQENHDLHLGFGGRYSNFKGGGNLRQYPEAYFASKFQLGYGYVTLNRFGTIGHTHIFQWRFAILIG